MLITTHTLVGAAIGQTVDSLPLAFLLGFLSHLALDKIPHFDPGIWYQPGDRYKLGPREWTIIILDIIFTIVLLVFLLPKSVQPAFALGALGGVLLDLIDNVPWWKDWAEKSRWLGWGSKMHNFFHFQKADFVKQHKGLMLMVQLILIALVFWYIKIS